MSIFDAELEKSGTLFDAAKTDREIKQVIKQQFTAASLASVYELGQSTSVGATGNYQKSWGFEWSDAEMQSVISSSVKYAAPTELGRKAKGVPKGALDLWVRRVIQPKNEKDIPRIAFLIGRKKAKEATPGQFTATKTFERITPTLNQQFLEPIGGLIVERLVR